MTPEAYARVLKALLPPGRVWRTDPDGTVSKLFLAAGDELERVELRARDLLEEADPRTANELLPDYERVLGLPSDGSLEERRARVAGHLLKRSRFRPVDFQEALAPILGQATDDVVVMENDRAFAVLVGDDREIFRFFVYRDPTLPGSYDVDAAQGLMDRMKPSHTQGHVIESIDFLCDDPFSLCDRDRLGGTAPGAVPADGPGGAIFVPENAGHFTTLGQAAPQHLWLCQDAAAGVDAAPAIGALSLSGLNGPSYEQAVSGWTRLGLGIADGTAQRFVLGSGVGPDPTTTSQLWLAYIDLTATPAATRRLFGLGGATPCDARVTTGPLARLTVAAVSADGAANPVTGGVRPVAVLYDRTNSRAVLYTDQEKTVGTYSGTVTDGIKGFGTGTAPAALMLWACLYTGAAAEISDAQVKSMLQALGWTIPWT